MLVFLREAVFEIMPFISRMAPKVKRKLRLILFVILIALKNSVTAPSETAKLVDVGILDLNMFRKFLKNSNSMFEVALSV